MTYRVGNHWGVTIVREGDEPRECDGHCSGNWTDADCSWHGTSKRREGGQLVAVVVNGDQALAERICQLLNHGCTRVGLHNCRGEWRSHDHEQAAADAPSARAISPQSASGASGVVGSGSDALSDSDGFCDRTDEHRHEVAPPGDSCTCVYRPNGGTDPNCPVHRPRHGAVS